MNLLKKLLCKNCSEALKTATKENEELKKQILEKQEQINKTNSYYKRKIYNMRKDKPQN